MFPDMYRRPLEAVQAAAVEVVLPLFRAMVDAAEGIILKLHEVQPDGSCTVYAWLTAQQAFQCLHWQDA